LRRFAIVSTLFFSALTLAIALPGCGGSSKSTLFIISAGNPAVGSFQMVGNGGLVLNSTSDAAGSGPEAIIMDSQRRYAYVVNNAGTGIYGGVLQYTIDHSKGRLNIVQAPNASSNLTVPVPPVVTGLQPVAAAIGSGNNFVFVANSGSNTISVFSLDQTTGALTEVPGSPFTAGTRPVSLVARGTSLWVANQGDGTVTAYSISQAGALTQGSTVTVGANTTSINANSGGTNVYVADGTANTVTLLTASGSTLTVGSSMAVGTAPSNLFVDSSGKYLYVTNAGSNDVSAFTIGSGALTAIGGSPFKAGAAPSYAATNAGGNYLYVANEGDGTVSSFQIGGSGSLTPATGSPFPAPGFGSPIGLAGAD
jgi:6-phosphogluconolactonase (cycloisomerase 2 family)